LTNEREFNVGMSPADTIQDRGGVVQGHDAQDVLLVRSCCVPHGYSWYCREVEEEMMAMCTGDTCIYVTT
jgi:hypothetical protein